MRNNMLLRRNPAQPATAQDRVYFAHGCGFVIVLPDGSVKYARAQAAATKTAAESHGMLYALVEHAGVLYREPLQGSNLSAWIKPTQSSKVANWKKHETELRQLFALRSAGGSCHTGSDDTAEDVVKGLERGIRPTKDDAFFVSYGAGVDSTAMLVGLVREYKKGNKRARPDGITFADTGGEFPETYFYVPIINEYLKKNGFPEVQTVRYEGTKDYNTLEASLLAQAMFPSVVYGADKRSCSEKWKHGPQEKVRRKDERALDAWGRGDKVIVAIGYDAGTKDAKRKAYIVDPGDKKDPFHYWYPLREWGWGRVTCEQAIAEEGLPVPRKSACYFCPVSQPWELDQTIITYPDLADRIIEIENTATPWQDKLRGLWDLKAGDDRHKGSMSAWIMMRRQQMAAGDLSWVPKGLERLAQDNEHSIAPPSFTEFTPDFLGKRQLRKRIRNKALAVLKKMLAAAQAGPRAQNPQQAVQQAQEDLQIGVHATVLCKPTKSLTAKEREQALKLDIDAGELLVGLFALKATDKEQKGRSNSEVEQAKVEMRFALKAKTCMDKIVALHIEILELHDEVAALKVEQKAQQAVRKGQRKTEKEKDAEQQVEDQVQEIKGKIKTLEAKVDKAVQSFQMPKPYLKITKAEREALPGSHPPFEVLNYQISEGSRAAAEVAFGEGVEEAEEDEDE